MWFATPSSRRTCTDYSLPVSRRTAIRFYALRLREAGMIKSNPNRIIAQGTNWRFFNELKQELKS
jgi:NitT/TauT family transport system substrate-binding protein